MEPSLCYPMEHDFAMDKPNLSASGATSHSLSKPPCAKSSKEQPSYKDFPVDLNDFQSNGQLSESHVLNLAGYPRSMSGLGISSEAFEGSYASSSSQSSLWSSQSGESRGTPSQQEIVLQNSTNYLFPSGLQNSQQLDSLSPFDSALPTSLDAGFFGHRDPIVTGVPYQTGDFSSIHAEWEASDSWTLEHISAVSGVPADVLATQLSFTAELALKYLSSSSNMLTSDVGDLVRLDAQPLTSNFAYFTPCEGYLSLLETERNLEGHLARNFASQAAEDAAMCINPADIMPPYILPSTSTDSGFSLPPQSSLHDQDSPRMTEEPKSPEFDVTARVTENKDPLSSAIPDGVSPLIVKVESKDDSDYEPSAHPSPSSSELFAFSSSTQARTAFSSKRKEDSTGSAVTNDPPQEIDLGTPVLDAHRGIYLDDLKAKADRYRVRNPGQGFDKSWLISFAGRLSAQGQLLNEFRCYIIGCTQTNKRRDHILIHVGAHLDQRPFKCASCPSRFLRKNECKRHEQSHTGNRPFSCNLCPGNVASFVRQDLLKRHLKRTHGLDCTRSNKENLGPPPAKRRRHI